jgi:predicted ester cyclase
MTPDERIAANRHLAEQFVLSPTAVPLADGVTWQDMGQNCTYQGQAAVTALLQAFFVEGFPAARLALQHLLVDEKKAVLQFTFYGRQDGPFMAIPATGRAVSVPMVLVCTLTDAALEQAALYYDAGTLLRQLGLAV